jgi:serine/threonine-protein kinase HipA
MPAGELLRVGELDAVFSEYGPFWGTTFRYDSSYLRDQNAYPLCPELPLTPGPIVSDPFRPLAGAFADSEPDQWGRRLLYAAERRSAVQEGRPVASFKGLGFLLAVPDATRVGALRFSTTGGTTFEAALDSGALAMADLVQLAAAAKHVEELDETDADIAALVAAGTSMGGARPKVTVLADDGNLAMAKLPSSTDRWDVLAWEAVCLALAKAAGINTPAFALTRIDEDSCVLVTKRFDRAGARRVGYLSADSLTRPGPNDVVSYTTFAERLGEESASPTQDCHELFKRVVFTLLVNNVDDHLKNHGLVRTAPGWRLSPLFDVNPFPRHAIESTPITYSSDPVNRTIPELLSAHDSFRLTREEAARIIRQVEEATRPWAGMATNCGIPADAADNWSTVFDGPVRESAAAAS